MKRVLKIFGNRKVAPWILIAIAVAGLAAITIFIVDAAMNDFETSRTQKVMVGVVVAYLSALVALPFLIYSARGQLGTDN